MTSNVFCRYDLRTTDAESARAFYTEIVGLDLDGTPENPTNLAVWPLHEQARARGAPPHWLGQIGVSDVDATLQNLVDAGAERLGPTVRARDGTPFATLRDPSGAVLAVRGATERPRRSPVAWHQLHTRDVDRAWALYADRFGWTHTRTIDIADVEGGHRMFAWDAHGETVGSLANTARMSGVHPHWLYFFRVTDLDGRIAKVRDAGGRVLGSAVVLPNGDRLVPCEDLQGAAFGMLEAARR